MVCKGISSYLPLVTEKKAHIQCHQQYSTEGILWESHPPSVFSGDHHVEEVEGGWERAAEYLGLLNQLS